MLFHIAGYYIKILKKSDKFLDILSKDIQVQISHTCCFTP